MTVRRSATQSLGGRREGRVQPSHAHPGGVWHSRLAAMQVFPQARPLWQVRQQRDGTGELAVGALRGAGASGVNSRELEDSVQLRSTVVTDAS